MAKTRLMEGGRAAEEGKSTAVPTNSTMWACLPASGQDQWLCELGKRACIRRVPDLNEDAKLEHEVSHFRLDGRLPVFGLPDLFDGHVPAVVCAAVDFAEAAIVNRDPTLQHRLGDVPRKRHFCEVSKLDKLLTGEALLHCPCIGQISTYCKQTKSQKEKPIMIDTNKEQNTLSLKLRMMARVSNFALPFLR